MIDFPSATSIFFSSDPQFSYSTAAMPPRRPLTDLDLITVIKQLTPNSQLNAARMSPRCRTLVRAANRRVKSLAITDNDNYKDTQKKVNRLFLASEPSMRKLRKIGQYFSDFPMTNIPLSKWNCLMVGNEVELSSPIIKLIVNSFSAVTALKFIALRNNAVLLKFCVKLLQQPQWANQLSQLMVGNYQNKLIPTELGCPLITAINRLSALQCLSISWPGEKLPDLTILNQLKAIELRCLRLSGLSFLSSLERFAPGNVGLQVYFHSLSTEALLGLSPPLRRCIVNYGLTNLPFYYTYDQVPLLCQQFPSLTSLAVKCPEPTHLRPLFTALSHLQQLVHLYLSIKLTGTQTEEELRPLAQLTSLRALDLSLSITSHSQVSWLNLQKTLPHCQTIHIMAFNCVSCDIGLYNYLYDDADTVGRSKALECLRGALPKLHNGVCRKQITVSFDEPYLSLDQIIE